MIRTAALDIPNVGRVRPDFADSTTNKESGINAE